VSCQNRSFTRSRVLRLRRKFRWAVSCWTDAVQKTAFWNGPYTIAALLVRRRFWRSLISIWHRIECCVIVIRNCMHTILAWQTPWSRVLGKLTVAQPVYELPTRCWTKSSVPCLQKLTTSLSWASWMQSMSSLLNLHNLLKINFNIILPSACTGIPCYSALHLALLRYSALAFFPPSFVYTPLLCANRWPGGISRCTHSLTGQLVEWGDDHAS
jgi:hypothetical protein